MWKKFPKEAFEIICHSCSKENFVLVSVYVKVNLFVLIIFLLNNPDSRCMYHLWLLLIKFMERGEWNQIILVLAMLNPPSWPIFFFLTSFFFAKFIHWHPLISCHCFSVLSSQPNEINLNGPQQSKENILYIYILTIFKWLKCKLFFLTIMHLYKTSL